MNEHHIIVTIGGVEHALTRNEAMGAIERLQHQLDITWREWIEDMLNPPPRVPAERCSDNKSVDPGE